MQRQKVQNFRGRTSMLISGSDRKSDGTFSNAKSKVQNILPIVVKELLIPFHLSCFKLVFVYSITLAI